MREKAIDWFSVLREKFVNTEFEQYLNMAISALEQTNTAEWNIVGKTTFHYECSKCGGAGDSFDKFCKHCGARMKEREEEG